MKEKMKMIKIYYILKDILFKNYQILISNYIFFLHLKYFVFNLYKTK